MDYLYICDGRACERNCAENGFAYCAHTRDENHAKNKIRRQRKFVVKNGAMTEVKK